jgi:site-specific DNA-methyltransferase (adenine-specific)
MIRTSKNQIIFGGNYFAHFLKPSSSWIVWDKDNGESFFADCELAWTSFDKAVRKFKWKWNGMLQEHMGKMKENRVHPTQKPLALMQWCIKNYSEDNMTILDPFMGSGTTLVAAKLLGRNATGIEISEKYCEIARERLRQEVLF